MGLFIKKEKMRSRRDILKEWDKNEHKDNSQILEVLLDIRKLGIENQEMGVKTQEIIMKEGKKREAAMKAVSKMAGVATWAQDMGKKLDKEQGRVGE